MLETPMKNERIAETAASKYGIVSFKFEKKVSPPFSPKLMNMKNTKLMNMKNIVRKRKKRIINQTLSFPTSLLGIKLILITIKKISNSKLLIYCFSFSLKSIMFKLLKSIEIRSKTVLSIIFFLNETSQANLSKKFTLRFL